MTILQTLGVFVGIPLAIYLVIGLLVFLPGRHSRRGYRAGEQWDYPPQLWAGDTPVQIPAGDALAGTSEGGARGSW
ncbi:hypothetical protein [Nakamurella aerolata]|uniref:Uncharacterized protein n=1 Tax=Nakamurella aerolata TaxID=1656892 RepID=A0A849AJY6_9ACTN|nr:hypothetical protein [Nakamurella aerolata]NNG37132.1 hypothetical protein [Nakamurella aerolata]